MNVQLTAPEITVLNWLTQHKIAFIPQEKMFGGRDVPGGAIADYYLPDSNIVIRVQSYWHTLPDAKTKDDIQRIMLENQGFIVVDVWEDDLKVNADQIMRMAVQGRSKEH